MLKRAIDVIPYMYVIIGRGEIVKRRWAEDCSGDIWFMFDNHTFLKAKENEELEVQPNSATYYSKDLIYKVIEEDKKEMSKRPVKKKTEKEKRLRALRLYKYLFGSGRTKFVFTKK